MPLGTDPYGPAAQALVRAHYTKGQDCACQTGDVPCDTPHEDPVVLECRNGHHPFPSVWVRGDCAAAYTGWWHVILARPQKGDNDGRPTL